MPNLLAMSFEGELAPSFDLRCLHPGENPPDGWGLGYYPGGEPSATVLKEPAPPHGSIRSELVKAWEHLESGLFVLHIRSATWGAISDANTQPFQRAWGRRDWLFAHSGSLRLRPALRGTSPFEPVGSTDTELVFCEILNRAAERGWRSLGEVPPQTLREWFWGLNELGNMTCLLTDGQDLAVYADRHEEGSIYTWEALPPYDRLVFADRDLELDLARRGVKSRKGVVVASNPLSVNDEVCPGLWRRLRPGHVLLVRQGAIRDEVGPVGEADQLALPGTLRGVAARPVKAEVRRYEVRHRTVYSYAKPVERSSHIFRLTPVHDRLQAVLDGELRVSVDGQWSDSEDVFGNWTRRLFLDRSYTELVIEAVSRVELRDTDPLSFRPLRARTTIPLVWMPWHRQTLQPYLLPPELAESELLELSEYAMSFAERNDYDLLDTLLDMNATIYREYKYVQGETNVLTTPFDVYATRRGVCQDFTNLFICLARLLSVPARYVCGYVYTGATRDNPRQAQASHAWVQLYLPQVGWKGFDPTNGILTQTEHVRVAVGRNYRDATPTSGTIYVGGGGESLSVDVQMTRLE
jgi:transglutaminase-like putative cysteine protease/predicted glutamine amidotransferase